MTGKISFMLSFLAAALFLGSQSALADSSAVKEMAQIVKNLDHRPSAKDQEALRKIVSNDASTPGERAIANALLQMNHQVSGADKEKLRAVKGDSSASPAEQELADIVMGLNHHASAKDKERLDQL